MTIEQLYDIIKMQQDEINALRKDYEHLKEWSDMNDIWLREMIDALTDTVDGIMDDHCCCEKYNTAHAERRKNKKWEENN
jgi:hypothetical protein